MGYSYIAPVTGVVTQASTAAAISIPVPGFGDIIKFEIFDETQFGLASADTDMLSAWWYKDMANGSAFVQNRQSGSAAASTTNMVTTGGFTLIDPTGNQLQSAKTGSGITNANPAVVTINSHGYSVGDVVRLYATTGMLQIAGLAFTITAVSTNTFTLGYLDASGFGAAATSVTAQKFNYIAAYYPRRKEITKISVASSAVITLSTTHNFTVGQLVRVYCPASFGMSQINGLLGTVTAISTTNNTITVNINSSSFSSFAFPTSAVAAVGVQMPFVEPVGEAATSPYQNLLDDATVNQSAYIMQLGSNVYGVASDVIRWIAWRGVVQS